MNSITEGILSQTIEGLNTEKLKSEFKNTY